MSGGSPRKTEDSGGGAAAGVAANANAGKAAGVAANANAGKEHSPTRDRKSPNGGEKRRKSPKISLKTRMPFDVPRRFPENAVKRQKIMY